MAILRTERVMIRAMCGVKLLDRRNSEKLMDMLDIEESFLDRIYVYNNANNELEKINNWLIANRLLLNTKKKTKHNILNSL